MQTQRHTGLQTQRHRRANTETHRRANTETHVCVNTETTRLANTDTQACKHRGIQAQRLASTQTYRYTDTQTHERTGLWEHRHSPTDTQTHRNWSHTVRFSLHLSTECRLREVIKHSPSKMTWPSRHRDVLMALSRETYNRRPSPPYPTQTSRSPTISRIMIPHFVDLLLHIRNWYPQSKQRNKWISPWNWKETTLQV